jgi:PKD repeat protein
MQGQTVAYGDCPRISRVLKRGASGDDVMRLQQFLATDPAIYPEGNVSGYYGALTEAAVQRWQAKFKIVSSGTPASTGYGITGPRTAALMALQCSGGVAAQVGGYIKVTPIAGSAPLNVSVEATINTTHSCGATSYALKWGDGSQVVNIPLSAGTCAEAKQTFSHTYTYGGTYIISLSAQGHTTVATVSVAGAAAPGPAGGVGGTVAASDSISASPQTGNSPLTVAFTGTVNAAAACGGGNYTLLFGDGQSVAIQYPASCTPQSYTVQHQYVSAGAYTANLVRGVVGSGGVVVGAATVTVGSATSGLSTPSLQPNVGNNPFAIGLAFDIPSACSGYDVDWGDASGHATQAATTCATSGIVQKSLSHTYAAAGAYTLIIKRGASLERTDTLSITISN